MWKLYAFGAALFAALTTILAKVGISGVDSNLATAVRSLVATAFAVMLVVATGKIDGLSSLTPKSWTFLLLSGLGTGLSWIFYFRALQLGPASKVSAIDKSSLALAILLAIIFLREAPDWNILVGGAMIIVGTYVVAFG